VEIREF